MQPVADLTQYGPHPVQPTTIQTATFAEATAVVIDRVGYGHFYQCPLGSITKHAGIVNATVELIQSRKSTMHSRRQEESHQKKYEARNHVAKVLLPKQWSVFCCDWSMGWYVLQPRVIQLVPTLR
jgi:hypothetical protein